MKPHQLRKVVLRWAAPLLAVVLIAAAVSYTVSRTRKPVYEAGGRLLVLGQIAASALGVSSAEIINTDAALITQAPLLQDVITSLNLAERPGDLAGQIQVTPVPQTELIDVKVRDPDPARAARIANGVMSAFVATGSKQTAAPSAETRAQLERELRTGRQQLADDQAALAAAQPGRQDAATLSAQVATDSARITQLTGLLAALDTQRQSGTPIQIASPATVPGTPEGTPPRTVAALGAFGGLLIGLTMILLLEYLDQGLRNEEDVRERLHLPTLAVVPRYRASDQAGHRGRTRGGAAAEAYRRLRTSILFSAVDTPLHSIVITSAGIGEGKSRTAANLAGIMAAAGERVLLVDADLRRPSQHRIFDRPMEAGLSEFLLRAAHAQPPDLNGSAATPFQNLSLLTAGTIPPNPSELLASKHMAGVLQLLERQHDLVVIDTPPSQLVTDALSVAAKASGTLLVVEPGRTNARQAEQAISALRNVGANVLGVVLNKARSRRRAADHYYYYYSPAEEVGPGDGDAAASRAWLPLGEPPRPAGAVRRRGGRRSAGRLAKPESSVSVEAHDR